MAEDANDTEVDLSEIDKNLKAALAADDDNGEDFIEGEVDTPEYTDAEQKAMGMGWNPDKETLKDSGKEWVPADEFLRNQTWVDEINKLKRSQRKQEQVLEAWKAQNKIVAENAYKQAMNDLKTQKLAAAADDDLATVIQIDEQIDVLKEERNAAKNEPEEAPIYSAKDWEDSYENFVANNTWYDSNRVVKAFADSVGTAHARSKEDVSPKEVYEHVISEVRKEFPDLFGAAPKPKAKAQAVTTPQRRSTSPNSKAKHTLDDIPEEHLLIARTLIKSGGISEADYLKQYFPEDYSS